MPRKPNFVRSDVINAAMEVFLTNGYEASSISKLLDAMQLNRGSLYGTFGDKENLFREVLKCYADETRQLVAETILKIDDPLEAIKTFFNRVLVDDEPRATKGCLMFNTITELRYVNPQLASEAVVLVSIFKEPMQKRLQEAQDKQLISADKNLKTLVDYLITMLSGLRTQTRSGLQGQEIKDIINLAMRSLQI